MAAAFPRVSPDASYTTDPAAQAAEEAFLAGDRGNQGGERPSAAPRPTKFPLGFAQNWSRPQQLNGAAGAGKRTAVVGMAKGRAAVPVSTVPGPRFPLARDPLHDRCATATIPMHGIGAAGPPGRSLPATLSPIRMADVSFRHAAVVGVNTGASNIASADPLPLLAQQARKTHRACFGVRRPANGVDTLLGDPRATVDMTRRSPIAALRVRPKRGRGVASSPRVVAPPMSGLAIAAGLPDCRVPMSERAAVIIGSSTARRGLPLVDWLGPLPLNDALASFAGTESPAGDAAAPRLLVAGRFFDPGHLAALDAFLDATERDGRYPTVAWLVAPRTAVTADEESDGGAVADGGLGDGDAVGAIDDGTNEAKWASVEDVLGADAHEDFAHPAAISFSLAMYASGDTDGDDNGPTGDADIADGSGGDGHGWYETASRQSAADAHRVDILVGMLAASHFKHLKLSAALLAHNPKT